MSKVKITVIKVGHIDHLINFNKIKRWKSKIFEIVDIQCVEHLSNSGIDDGFLDMKYSRENLSDIIKEIPQNTDVAMAIMLYRFTDNYYLHKDERRAVLSLYGINDVLDRNNISMENFIVRQFYKLSALTLFNNCLNHRDTRGCLYDMNGNREDIIYNTETPLICDDCKSKIKKCQIPNNLLHLFEKELKKIKKPFFLKVELYIKKHPLFSMFLGIGTGIVFSKIFDLVKFLIERICKIIF
jgi:hypothetical protein